mgnify:CR=1 FL=1
MLPSSHAGRWSGQDEKGVARHISHVEHQQANVKRAQSLFARALQETNALLVPVITITTGAQVQDTIRIVPKPPTATINNIGATHSRCLNPSTAPLQSRFGEIEHMC